MCLLNPSLVCKLWSINDKLGAKPNSAVNLDPTNVSINRLLYVLFGPVRTHAARPSSNQRSFCSPLRIKRVHNLRLTLPSRLVYEVVCRPRPSASLTARLTQCPSPAPDHASFVPFELPVTLAVTSWVVPIFQPYSIACYRNSTSGLRNAHGTTAILNAHARAYSPNSCCHYIWFSDLEKWFISALLCSIKL